ncbi:PE-PPE domain-containing protein [Mycobacterium sp.]|uniref:PE-PPE domain-containing protein n=1 Tax=Mycobacterium sp. TaxID=1785 RepID=UPI0031DE9A54
MLHSAFAYGDTVGLIIGGSGIATPGPDYVDEANTLFIHPNFTDTAYPPPAPYTDGLTTPEGFYPETGIKTLPYNFPNGASVYPDGQQTSVGQGAIILENAINSNAIAGNESTVFGYSQSTTISTAVMQQLDPSGQPDTSLHAQFVLIADLNAPDGGLLSRFDLPGVPLQFPSLGLAFDGVTPADDFTTVIYTREWDGFADFPRYPINLLADFNAFAGIETLHGAYLQLSPEQIAPESATDPGGAIELPTSGATETTYYMIPTADLPLLDPIRAIAVIGNPVADLLQPDLTLLVNLGYDNPDPLEGWDAGPANVHTTFALFPPLDQILDVLRLLPSQTLLGIHDFIDDFTGSGPNPVAVSLASLPAMLTDRMSSGVTDPLTLLPSPADIPNLIGTSISSEAATLYSVLLPTADFVNAAVTVLPGYDASLFLDNLANPVDAVGLPLAADAGLLTLFAGFELEVVNATLNLGL